jgi:O-antigen ligase
MLQSVEAPLSLADARPKTAAVLTLAAAVFALVASRLVLASIAVLLVVILLPVVSSGQGRRRLYAEVSHIIGHHPLAAMAVAAFGVTLLVSSTGSPAGLNGFGKAALFIGLTLAALVSAASLRLRPAGDRATIGRGLLVGIVTGAAFLLAEEATGHVVKGWLFNVAPVLRPDARHLQTDGDLVAGVRAYVTNRNIAVLTLLTFPAIALASRLLAPTKVRVATGVLLAVSLAATMLSAHASSRLAIAGGCAVAVITLVSARIGAAAVVAIWIALTTLLAPAAVQLSRAGFDVDPRVPFSFQARIILWTYTSGLIPDRLWRGVGIDGTKPLDAARNKTWETRPGHVYPQRTGEHAHNVYIQLLYELGVLGMLTFFAFGSALIGLASRTAGDIRPWALGLVTTAMLLAATSWGAWQPWFMGAYAMSALAMIAAANQIAYGSNGAPTGPREVSPADRVPASA